jgi:protein TonB
MEAPGSGAGARPLFSDWILPGGQRRDERRMAPAIGCSAATHAVGLVLALLLVYHLPPTLSGDQLAKALPGVVWLNQPGPGGGGGGGGNRMPEPVRKIEAPGRDLISIPVAKPAPVQAPAPQPPADAPTPDQQISAPIMYAGAALDTKPGALDGASSGLSQGPGSGGGSGRGRGTGIGNGDGPGIGDGWGGGTGNGPYRPGSGIETPVLVREVKPLYTNDAMRAKIQGTAWLECVVLPDGTVGNVRITRSLDSTFGLDQEAIKAARQWRFRPGRRLGQPVAVLITIAMDFHLQ